MVKVGRTLTVCVCQCVCLELCFSQASANTRGCEMHTNQRKALLRDSISQTRVCMGVRYVMHFPEANTHTHYNFVIAGTEGTNGFREHIYIYQEKYSQGRQGT